RPQQQPAPAPNPTTKPTNNNTATPTPPDHQLPAAPAADVTSQENAVANPPPRPAGPQWKYIPVPDNEPEKHDEYATLSSTNDVDHTRLIAARVRGKKHKHEGTNCDDWFEVRTNKHWSLIAVADGAGSRKFSRVGAKASCQAAVECMTESFKFQPPNQPPM